MLPPGGSFFRKSKTLHLLVTVHGSTQKHLGVEDFI